MKTWLIRKDPDAGKDWRQEEKGTTEDEILGWHHWLYGHEFEQAPGVGDGQVILACRSPWFHKESDTSEWLNRTELRTWKQSTFPSTDERIKKLWYIYTMEYYWAIKGNGCESVELRWMSQEPVIQTKSEREKQILYTHTHTHTRNLEKWNWWTYFQGRSRNYDIENRLVDTVGKGESGIIGKSNINLFTLPCVK